MKDSFILYLDQQKIFEMLTDEQAGQLIKNIFLYERTGQMPKMDKMLNLAFVPIMQILDKNRRKYEEKCKKNKENIDKRWNKNNTVVYERKKLNTNYTDNDNDNVNDNVNDNDKDNIKDNIKDTINIKNNNKNKKEIERKNIKKESETEIFQNLINSNFNDEELKDTLKEFIKMRNKIKKPLTERGLTLIIKKLYKLSKNTNEQIEILNNSIMNNWQGIFPLKNERLDDFKELWEEAQNEQSRNNTSNNFTGW